MVDDKREMLRHTIATVAYRAAKILRDVPEGFGRFGAGEGTRTAGQVLAHVCDLFDWALSIAEGKEEWRDSEPQSWEQDVARFFSSLGNLDDRLKADAAVRASAERLFQGPIADALTHLGQIAMLRRLVASPIRGENYFRAEIAAGRLGPQQASPRREFD